jgi:opacity protein-like surface antigen
MLSHLKSRLARRLTMLAAMIAVLCTFAALAAAQDEPPPKWELFGGYSVFDPGATVYGELP